MIKGMTAYSIREKKFDSWVVTSEIWSYNHKFLRVNLSIPSEIRKYSEKIENLIRKVVSRGKINLKLDFSNVDSIENKVLNYNKEVADEIYKIGEKVKKENEKPLEMREILLIPGVLEISKKSPELSKYWPQIKKLIENTCSDLFKTKKRQGEEVAKDLSKTIEAIRYSLKKIKKSHKQDKNKFSDGLNEKIEQITDLEISEEKIEEETVNYIRNKDINEEVTRVFSYLELLQELLESEEPVGKKIDFIAQELLRETNTIGAKKNNVIIKKEVVEIKEKIEKIREHSQNIE